MENEFEVFYPGCYSPEDRAVMDGFLAINEGIRTRRLDPERLDMLPRETPGFRGGRPVQKNETSKDAKKYDRHNPLYFDDDYARSLGYRGRLAFQMAACPDAAFYIGSPPELFQFLLAHGLNHDFTFHTPVYPGDTLYCVIDRREVKDLTPEDGCVYRTLDITASGCIYNQRGELVTTGVSNIKESLKRFSDPARDPSPLYNWDNPDYHTPGIWESGDWWSRPAHVYTDADWKLITEHWRQERRRGAEPLYWDDVAVGEQIPETWEGPFTAASLRRGMPQRPKGGPAQNGGKPPEGGPDAPHGPPPDEPEDPSTDWRTTKDRMLDPETFRTMVRCEENGIWYSPEDLPQRDGNGTLPKRGTVGNYMPVAFLFKTLFDWMGDRGRLRRIRWCIMPHNPGVSTELVPEARSTPDYLSGVPALRGTTVTAHALLGDLCINSAQIVDKYYEPGVGYLAELVWWCRTLEGDIFEQGMATVILPKRED